MISLLYIISSFTISTDLSHLEVENLFHVEWKLDEEHIPTPVRAHMGDEDSQKGWRSHHSAPGHGQLLQENEEIYQPAVH